MAHIHIGEDRICIRRLIKGFRYIFAQPRHYHMIDRLISEKIYLYIINLYNLYFDLCTNAFLKRSLTRNKKIPFP